MSNILSVILFTPLVGAILLLFVSKRSENAIRWIANLFAVAGFLVSVPLWFWYNPQNPDYQFQERLPWIPSIGAEYFLGPNFSIGSEVFGLKIASSSAEITTGDAGATMRTSVPRRRRPRRSSASHGRAG